MSPAKLFACVAALVIASASAHAQSYPTKSIRVMIPFGAGSATDVVPRIALEQMSSQIGQPVIVENRGGAGGTIGTAAAAKADPDGYSLLITSSAHTLAPALYANLPYDPGKDFVAVGVVGLSPNVMIMAPSRGIKTIQDFVAQAKAKPGSFSFATLGIGSGVHMSAERFRLSAGYEAVHVPFRGGAEALTEVIAGRVDYYFCPLATALPFIQQGQLVPLVISSPKRSSVLPDVPTTVEAGYPDSDYPIWIGMFAPAGTPKPVVDKLNAELRKALDSPQVKKRFGELGVEESWLTPAEFDARVKREIEEMGAFAKRAGMKAN
jgi:tripartite-type tricarboxylate transporter receptor subunit TctC